MKLLIIGGTGQVGREMADLRPAGIELSLPARGEVDLTDRAAVAAAVGAGGWSAAINLAAWTAVDKAETAVAEAFALNALGPAILAEETRKAGIPLVHVSTDYVFDGRKATAYDEDDPANPLGVYGASKLAGELAVRTGNPRHLIVRTAWVFGRHGANFVKTMLRLAAERPVVRVVDDQRGTPTGAKDLAEALLTMTARFLADGDGLAGTCHFANAGETTWCGLAEEVFRLSAERGGKRPELVPITTPEYPTRAKRPANSRLSTAKLTAAFGIAPRRWEDALAEVITALSRGG
jgi:dTDP-4-dehydrorhamnose reductase